MNQAICPSVKKVLTVGYLLSVFVVTAATSKSRDGGVAPLGSGTTNFSIETNCQPSSEIVAIRAENGTIRRAMTSNRYVNTNPSVTFRSLGFPNQTMLVGTDQYGVDTFAPEKCLVKNTYTRPNPMPIDPASEFVFADPGSLTTYLYDCYEHGNYVCSISLTELPAGELQNVW